MTLLRPNTAKVERKTTTGTSLTGSTIPGAPATIYDALPCFIEKTIRPPTVVMAPGAQAVTDEVVIMVADGVKVSGWNPGDHVTVRGIDMIVDETGRTAFPDVLLNDRITDGAGTAYVVLGVPQKYGTIKPTIQIHLAAGKAW